jgi:hypothetical protein
MFPVLREKAVPPGGSPRLVLDVGYSNLQQHTRRSPLFHRRCYCERHACREQPFGVRAKARRNSLQANLESCRWCPPEDCCPHQPLCDLLVSIDGRTYYATSAYNGERLKGLSDKDDNDGESRAVACAAALDLWCFAEVFASDAPPPLFIYRWWGGPGCRVFLLPGLQLYRA